MNAGETEQEIIVARRADQRKNIFCLETDSWFGRKDRTSVEPVLELLKVTGRCDYIRRDVATRGEFEYFLNQYFCRGYKNYPILHLSFHGSDDPPSIFLGNNERINLDELAEMMGDQCSKRVVYFGSCSTMNAHGNKLRAFMRKTGALGVLGYREEVGWLQSAAFEVLILGSLQEISFTKQGVRQKFDRLLKEQAKHLYETLGFRLIA